mgnify:CR=1 FL=1
MKTILVASKNPVKIQAARDGFTRMFPGEMFEVRGVSTPSGVSDQPFSNQETLQGALNRAANARDQFPDADYCVGIEGGVEPWETGDLTAFAWVVVLERGEDRRIGKGRTGTFFLPPRVAALVREGKELGEADDIVFGRTNSKQENGAVGILTDDVIDRAGFYAPAVILALIPLKNKDLY